MKHLVIIGGGVIGLSTAHYALQRGLRVTVIERGAPSHDSCSLGNAGMIVPSHFVPLAAPGMVAMGLKMMWNPESPFYIRPRLDGDLLGWMWKFWRSATKDHVDRAAPLIRDLSFASRQLFVDLAARHGNPFHLVEKGLLMLCRTEDALKHEAAGGEAARALGIPAELLDAKQTADLDPGVRMDITGSVYFPKDCHLSPALFTAMLTRLCQEAGADFRWETEVTGWRTAGDRIAAVRTAVGEIAGDEFVLAGGSWSPLLTKDLGISLPMQAGKGYSLTLPAPRQLPALCSIFVEARMAITPMNGTLRFGGTMEIAGLDESITARRVRGIIRNVPHYFPEFRESDFDGIPPWRGLRPCSPDGMPYMGRFRSIPNLIAATGHAMMGLSLGPVSGQIIADIAAEKDPTFDVSLLRPDRFA